MKNIVILILFAILISCNQSPKKVESPIAESQFVNLSTEQLSNTKIITGNLEKRSISNVLKLNGKIEVPPQNMISISVPLGGYLKMTKLLPGMPIKRGDVLAVIEDQQYIQLQQDYLTANARLIYSQKEYERQSELNQIKASSDKVFQMAQADYTALKVQHKSLSEKLKLIGIHPENLDENTLSRSVKLVSPIDGYVTKVNYNIGKYISPTDVLFELVNQSDIHLTLTVFEKELEKLFVGQKMIAFTNSNPEKKYDCEIILLGKVFANDKSVQVHCHFKKYDLSLIPGTFMNANIDLKTKEALVLPEQSIVSYESKNYIFKKKSKLQFELIEVNIGNAENGFVEIISNTLTTKDTIVINDAYNLLMTLKNKAE